MKNKHTVFSETFHSLQETTFWMFDFFQFCPLKRIFRFYQTQGVEFNFWKVFHKTNIFSSLLFIIQCIYKMICYPEWNNNHRHYIIQNSMYAWTFSSSGSGQSKNGLSLPLNKLRKTQHSALWLNVTPYLNVWVKSQPLQC